MPKNQKKRGPYNKRRKTEVSTCCTTNSESKISKNSQDQYDNRQ